MNFLIKLYSGRIDKKNYFLGLLLFFSPVLLSAAILPALFPEPSRAIENFGVAVVIVCMLLIISLHIRRLHDFDYSGFLVIPLFIIPIIGIATLIYFIVKDGQKEDNKYGAAIPEGAKFMEIVWNRSVLNKINDSEMPWQ